jgi:hypothetical protein
MKTTAWIYSVGLIVLAIAFSYGSADAEIDTARDVRDLRGFDSIEVGGGFDVHILQGDQFLVEVFAAEGQLDHVITEIHGSTLEIRGTRGGGKFFGIFPSGGQIDVTLPELTAVRASGGSDVMGLGKISVESLEIVASGGADVTLDVDVDTLEVVSSGGSDINLSGEAEFAALKTSGGSDVNAGALIARDVQVQTSGGSDARISVTGRLFGSVSGGSDVSYFGDPETIDVKVSGGGDLSGR